MVLFSAKSPERRVQARPGASQQATRYVHFLAALVHSLLHCERVGNRDRPGETKQRSTGHPALWLLPGRVVVTVSTRLSTCKAFQKLA